MTSFFYKLKKDINFKPYEKRTDEKMPPPPLFHFVMPWCACTTANISSETQIIIRAKTVPYLPYLPPLLYYYLKIYNSLIVLYYCVNLRIRYLTFICYNAVVYGHPIPCNSIALNEILIFESIITKHFLTNCNI